MELQAMTNRFPQKKGRRGLARLLCGCCMMWFKVVDVDAFAKAVDLHRRNIYTETYWLVMFIDVGLNKLILPIFR